MKGFMYFNWTLFLVYQRYFNIYIGFQYRNKCDYA